jgi:hypothetical protein
MLFPASERGGGSPSRHPALTLDVNGYVPFVLEKSHPSFLFHESPYIFPQEQHDGCYKWRMNCLPFQSTKVHPVLTGLPVVHFVQFCVGNVVSSF